MYCGRFVSSHIPVRQTLSNWEPVRGQERDLWARTRQTSPRYTGSTLLPTAHWAAPGHITGLPTAPQWLPGNQTSAARATLSWRHDVLLGLGCLAGGNLGASALRCLLSYIRMPWIVHSLSISGTPGNRKATNLQSFQIFFMIWKKTGERKKSGGKKRGGNSLQLGAAER